MSRYRLRAAPGHDGSVTGTLRRREGDDFRLAAYLQGVEWELPAVGHLITQAERALPDEWTEREVTLSIRWRKLDVEPPAFPWRSRWHLKRRSDVRPLAASPPQNVIRFDDL